MPGTITHLIVQQRMQSYLKELGQNSSEYSQLMAKDPFSKYANFGSTGPDFLFFSLKEYGTPLDEIVNFIFDVYDKLEPFIEFYEKYIEPIEQKLDDAIAALDEALFNGLIADLEKTVTLITKTAQEAILVIATKEIDFFYPFYPKIQQGAKESDWYWVDFLHYRRTGQFLSNMWKHAQGDDDLMRYCMGYTSHIGTDVVGHSYVNAITGGPFRTHWHRHHLVENWIDAYARNYYPDSAALINSLNLGPDDKYLANNISGSYYYKLCEFPDGKLPKKLGDMFLGAMNSTYSDIDHPTKFNFDDLDTTYRLWLEWFKRSTRIGSAQPPTPVAPPGSGIITLVNDYVSGIPSYSGGSGGSGGSGFSIWGVLAAIARFIEWLGEVLAYTFEWIITHATDIFLLPYTEAIQALKYFLYLIQAAVYNIYDNLRFMLVLAGYMTPESKDLTKNPWGKAFLNTSYAHLTGGASAQFYNYPRKQENHGLFGTTEHHLIYPGTLQELQHAQPAPMPFHGQYPEAFISKGYKYDPYIENLFYCKTPYGNNIDSTHHVDQNTWNSGQFGNASMFSARLIINNMDKMPDFNLDADRGYGWKTWRAKDPKNINSNNPVEVEYID